MNPKAGGISQAIRGIIPAFQSLGVSGEVVCSDSAGLGYFKDDPFMGHAVGEAKGPWAYNSKLPAWLQVNLERFDAVIVHGLWQYHGYAVSRAIRDFDRRKCKSIRAKNGAGPPPIYVMPHGMLDPYFQRDPSRKVKALRNWLYWKLIEHRLVRCSEGVLFTCEEEKRLAQGTFRPYDPRNEFVVGLGVEEPPEFRPAMEDAFFKCCPEVSNRPYLLFISRIHPKKGIDLLIRSYAKVFAASGSKGIPSLVVAGPLDSAYASTMQQLASALCPPSSKGGIFFTGMLQGNAKWGALHGANAFILPSHQENFGIAVVEAMACGKAVLISNKVNIWREIEMGKGGIVEDDTLNGTSNLLLKWFGLSVADEAVLGYSAKEIFRKLFLPQIAALTLKGVLDLPLQRDYEGDRVF